MKMAVCFWLTLSTDGSIGKYQQREKDDMDKIQVVFLFVSNKQLKKSTREKIEEIVRHEYGRIYGRGQQSVEIMLEDGMCPSNPSEIVLAIEKQHNEINEAAYRTELISAVADKLLLIQELRNLGFGGKINWQDGLAEKQEKSPAPEEADSKRQMERKGEFDALDYHKRAKMYQSDLPKYTFEMLKIPKETMDNIDQALARIEFEQKVFQEWGLYAIMPNPVAAMSFFGPPGTGKSLAAEAIASRLKKRIIRASYADIENKYVGEGPKNVSALFIAAEEQDAVLLIDEADSLLSKRLVNVQEASGQAINSMRSQLLISLERFHGIVIFATNLVVNYDAAFISRLINVEFTLPDGSMREEIWKTHLLPRRSGDVELNIPLADDVDISELAKRFELSGRDIRNSVIDACVEACRLKKSQVDMDCLCNAARRCQASSNSALNASDHTVKVNLTDQEKDLLAETLQRQYDENHPQSPGKP